MATIIDPADVPAYTGRKQVPARHNLALREAAGVAPRPYLHPVRSNAGVTVTDAGPADHPHHLGLSVAFSDVNGTNFWGGSTYTSDGGPLLLPNHGTQVPEGWVASPEEEAGRVSWLANDRRELAVEQRRISYFRGTTAGTSAGTRSLEGTLPSWSLSLASVIVPAPGVERLEVSSSAVKGRKGAGYGGIFWRFPAGSTNPLVLSEAGAGADAAHGSLSRWLSISLQVDAVPVTVLLAQEPGQLRPWFIRADGYLGAGPAVAWAESVVVDHSNPLRLALHAVVHDGPVSSAAHALELLKKHPLVNTGSPDRTS